ncbi:MAG: YbbR-like domain-containing protein [Bacteroidaceae bacterium]|nr:YbbR-like domain-containing protein [Bacteroidaceae bacterium]
MKKHFWHIVHKVKDFLLSKNSREFFTFLFFLLIAALFWLEQTLDREYEIEVKVPLKLKNVPENIVITSDFPEELMVTLRDKGNTLLNYQLTKRFYPINIDFEEHKNRRHHVSLTSNTYSKSIAAQLANTTSISVINPDTIDYYYSEGKSKKVPVRLQARVTPGQQYYISDTIFNPPHVTVYAPQGSLDTVKAAYTQYFEETQIEDTLRRKISLLNGRGVKFVPEEVEVTLPVDIYTEKSVEVPIEGVNFPADKTLRAFPSKVKVTFHVGLSRYLDITADDFHVVVSYEELRKLEGDKYEVKLKKVPDGVSKVRLYPSQIDFLIENVTHDPD